MGLGLRPVLRALDVCPTLRGVKWLYAVHWEALQLAACLVRSGDVAVHW